MNKTLIVPVVGVVVVLGLAVCLVPEVPDDDAVGDLRPPTASATDGGGPAADRLGATQDATPLALRPVASLGLHDLDRATDLGAASLFDLNEQLVGQSSKGVAKQQAKLAKLQDDVAQAEAQQDAWQAQLDELAESLPDLQQQHDDAAATVAELEAQGADKAAVQAARKELKAAAKALGAAQGKRKSAQKKLAKSAKKLARLQDKLDAQAGDLNELEVVLETLLGDFAFDAYADVAVDIQVLADAALTGARIDLVAPLDAEGLVVSTERYAQGLVVDGRCALTLRLLTAVDSVDVIVTAPGYTGTWTHEAVRVAQGAFAPAVRLTVPVADLAQLSVSLVPGGLP